MKGLDILLGRPKGDFTMVPPSVAIAEDPNLEARREQARQWMRAHGIRVLGDPLHLERKRGLI